MLHFKSLQYQYNIKQAKDENTEKYQYLGNYNLIQYQFLQSNITSPVWQTVRRTTNEFLGVTELKVWGKFCLTMCNLFPLRTLQRSMGDRIKPLKFLRDVLLPPEMDVEKEMVDVLPKLPARKEDIFITSYPRSGSFTSDRGLFSKMWNSL